MFAMAAGPRYSKEQARQAISLSHSYSEALRRLGMRPAGGNHQTLKHYAHKVWKISTDHFDPYHSQRGLPRRDAKQLAEILVKDSSYYRGHLKRRLYQAGLKDRKCELCGQDENWLGRRMSLILDHINGVGDDHRLENLRIVCPNCAATLDTHCGRNLLPREPRRCLHCGVDFRPRRAQQRYCSRRCATRRERSHLCGPRPERRRVERPPYEQLIQEIEELGYLAVGRKYGVSDNAIRKWLRCYEREQTAPRAA
jgi:hypothetical protein